MDSWLKLAIKKNILSNLNKTIRIIKIVHNCLTFSIWLVDFVAPPIAFITAWSLSSLMEILSFYQLDCNIPWQQLTDKHKLLIGLRFRLFASYVFDYILDFLERKVL